MRMPVWLRPKRSAAMGYEKVDAAGVSCLPQTSSMTVNAFLNIIGHSGDLCAIMQAIGSFA